jgi:hypothetical protein
MDQFVKAVAPLVWHGPGSHFYCVPTFVYSATVVPISSFLLPSFASVDSAALIVFKK